MEKDNAAEWMKRKKESSILQKERLTNDVRYQDRNEITLDCEASERNGSQGLFLFCIQSSLMLLQMFLTRPRRAMSSFYAQKGKTTTAVVILSGAQRSRRILAFRLFLQQNRCQDPSAPYRKSTIFYGRSG